MLSGVAWRARVRRVARLIGPENDEIYQIKILSLECSVGKDYCRKVSKFLPNLGALSMGTQQDKLRAIYLSGTVQFPPKFPEMAVVTYKTTAATDTGWSLLQVVVEQRISPKVLITRTFFVEDVSAIFYPHAAAVAKRELCDFSNGTWFVGEDVNREAERNTDDPVQAIVFVRENAKSLLEVEAGLTAAESAEYYPPLPTDRSQNHYRFKGDGDMAGCPIGGF